MEHLGWLDNYFIGRTKEPSKAKDMKKSFILGAFNFILVCFLGGNCVSWEVIAFYCLEKMRV